MIKKTRGASSKEHKLTFILPAADPEGPVSVVGDFNQWTPGAHELRKRSNGTRSAAIELPPGTYHFRYLAEGGTWANDPEAPCRGDDNVIDLR
jgi:1,4-alpha-glucan branching enzyme